MPMIKITSDSLIVDIENNFRISAGPGAGKTFWLTEHIKNVLHRSKRLGKTRKIACITYTNIGVDTILKRLGTCSASVDVSTIHSFLYKNIIKPYISFISSAYHLNVSMMDGHDEHFVSMKNVKNWIENHPNAPRFIHPYSMNQLLKRPELNRALINLLGSYKYIVNGIGEIEPYCERSEAYYLDSLNRRKYINAFTINLLLSDLLAYKKLYWQYGKIHHEDVLFFSYQIIKRFPFVLNVISAKYPYFFIDEFQDSNPIQVKILKKISESGSIIGIIGDKAQSIYKFQGADPSQFMTFSLLSLQDYTILDNKRSSNEIVELLNIIRTDLSQTSTRNIHTSKPVLLVGDKIIAYRKAVQLSNDETVVSLSRDNITANIMKKNLSGLTVDKSILEHFNNQDSDRNRRKFILKCIRSVEFAKGNKFKDAIHEFENRRMFAGDKIENKKYALKIIQILLSGYNSFSSGSLFDFLNFVRTQINSSLAKVVRGKVKELYDNHNYNEISLCVNIPEDESDHKTIHNAKGDEFNNVIVVLKDENCIDFILDSHIDDNTNKGEEHRIYYVASSRAKNNLFFNVPSLSSSSRSLLTPSLTVLDV